MEEQVFRSLGFDEGNVDKLAAELKRIACSGSVWEASESEHGTKYAIDGTLPGPQGREALVRTVWIVEKGEEAPRFVTAYPRFERSKVR